MSKLKMILATGQAPMVGHLSAYANNINALVPAIFQAMYVTSRELTGYIPSVSRAVGAERVAFGQSIVYPVSPEQVLYPLTPAMAVPDSPDNTFTTDSMVLDKAYVARFGFTGEEQKFLNSGGLGYVSAQGQLIAESLRTITNAIEADISVVAAAGASRAYGIAGTTPFGSGDLTDLSQLQKILDDNGAPATGRSAILDTSAAAKLRAIGNVSKVNEAGTNMTLRNGELVDIYGLSIKQTGQPITKVKGTGAGSTTNTAGYAKGATVITLAAAGTGTITAGDVITFAGDLNKYVVASGDADVSNGGTITLQKPGLRVAIPTAATAITIGGNYTANIAFSQDAIRTALRPPAVPLEGDLALDRMAITDPYSGVTFEFSFWPGYRKVVGEIAVIGGHKAIKPQHIAMLLG
jgi:P22 coat protein - gene protein 5